MAQEESEGRDWGSALGEGFRKLILVGRNRLEQCGAMEKLA